MGGKGQTTIYHNPKCGTSRKVLGMLREAGVEPVVIEYLKNPPDKKTLETLLRDMGLTPRELLRRKEAPYVALGLAEPGKSDTALIDAIVANPILMERPIVVSPRGTRLCRPAERVQDLLP